MKKLFLVVAAFGLLSSAQAAETPKPNAKKTAPSKIAPSATKAKPKPEAQAATQDWAPVTCGEDLKKLFENIEAYQKKLVKAADPLPVNKRQELYAGESVFAESLTLMTPEVFWKDIMASRQSRGCHSVFKSLKKSLSTNDSKGSPAKLNRWNKCVMVLYGTLPKQTQQINACVKKGVSHIKARQKSSKS